VGVHKARKALSAFRKAIREAGEGRELAERQVDELERQARDLGELTDFYAQRTDRGRLPVEFGGFSRRDGNR